MAPIRYSLHYEDYSEHLMSRFGKLLQMQSLVDMTLMCNSHTLRVHKAVLAASSAYFQEVLQKQTGEPLIILKMRFSVLKCLVEFMYCGKTQCLEENLDELVSAAQFLKIKGLSKVTKEGLGITNQTELPVFTPPIVINRPAQASLPLHSQNLENKPLTPPSSSFPPTTSQVSQLPPVPTNSQPIDTLGRANKDMVVRIPFDIDGSGAPSGSDYPEVSRFMKPRRGRPSMKRPGSSWDSSRVLGRAAERALLRREQDSRKAIHQLKHMQSRHMQDYMEQVTLSQAVNSICGSESSTAHGYMNIDSDLMYMDQTVSSNVLDPINSFSKEHTMSNETITSTFSTAPTSSACETSTSGIGTAMSQYVNALKSAGLPTDLPILFESGDGSYINVNEQVLLDMVQSSEIQYEVIEQPNIIEKVADPSEIKSIDDLSKSIERGEMLIGPKSYPSSNSYNQNNQFNSHEDSMKSLNSILPDNMSSFNEQQNFVVLDSRLQEDNSNLMNANDFSCIDGDMQFFTKSMSDDVKKYYAAEQQLSGTGVEQLCPTSSSLDTNFTMSLLDTKSSHLSGNIDQQYNSSLNAEDLRRNEDCYDFGLQLPQGSGFKEDTLDCLMSTPKRPDDDATQLDKRAQERDDIIQDLMNMERNIAAQNSTSANSDHDNIDEVFNDNTSPVQNKNCSTNVGDLTTSRPPDSLQWAEAVDPTNEDSDNMHNQMTGNDDADLSAYHDNVIDLTDTVNKMAAESADLAEDNFDSNKENVDSNLGDDLENDIPYAVGLLPLKQVQPPDEDNVLLKRTSVDDLLENADAKCLKRKVKCKKI